MRFQDTRFWKNYHRYTPVVAASSTRCTVDGLIYWKLLNAFWFESFLEIGIFEGQTTGLFYESNPNAKVTAIDPVDRLNIFRELYPEAQSTFKLINDCSCNVELDGCFDFILIDGNHAYETVCLDIENCLPLLSPTGVLVIDDYNLPGVAIAIEKLYNKNSALRPFLRTQQSLFWHHADNDRNNFLDNLLTSPITNFVFIENIVDHHNNVICSAKTLALFTDTTKYFDLALTEYDT